MNTNCGLHWTRVKVNKAPLELEMLYGGVTLQKTVHLKEDSLHVVSGVKRYVTYDDLYWSCRIAEILAASAIAIHDEGVGKKAKQDRYDKITEKFGDVLNDLHQIVTEFTPSSALELMRLYKQTLIARHEERS
jgi:hypothetical protein